MNFVSSSSGIAMGRRQREQQGQRESSSKLAESRRRSRRKRSNDNDNDAVLVLDEEASASSASSSTHEWDQDDDDDENDDNGRPSGWRRADRLARATATPQDPLLASTSRLELQREKGILEDALKDSLSTLLMLRPANTSAKLPDFLRAPHSQSSSITPSSKSIDTSEYSLSTSPSSTVTATAPRRAWPSSLSQNSSQSPQYISSPSSLRAAEERGSPRRPNMNRRRTVTTLSPKTTDTALVEKGKNRASRLTQGEIEEDLSANWAEATLSSTSSFEDLGFDDFEQDEDEEDSPTKRKSSISTNTRDRHTTPKARRLNLPASSPRSHDQQSSSPRSGLLTSYHARTTPRPLRPSRISSALRRSAPPSYGLPRSSGALSGIQSEPELFRDDVQADETFLELLEAARTFISMSPSAISSSSTAGSLLASSSKRPTDKAEDSPLSRERRQGEEQIINNSSSRATTPPSPQVPTSMSTSTTFVLSSSDSPPSRGLASSREGLDDDESNGFLSPIAQDENPEGSLSSTVRAQKPAQPQTSVNVDAINQKATEEEKDSESSSVGPEGSGGWWDWLSRQYKKITIGIGMLGIGFVMAIGVGLIKKPSFRRSVGPAGQAGLFARISFA